MSLCLGYGTSSGGLNTEGNLSDSSFLEALCGLEFVHADFADVADFLLFSWWFREKSVTLSAEI